MPLYNRIAAANYDTTWALHRNPMWANDSVPGHGGDCTNFVSQALHAGGWIMIPPSYLSLCPWYAEPFDYSRRSRTPSWASANHFGKLLRICGRARPCLFSELMIGDVIQQGLPGYDYPSHTMIVTKIAQGNIYLSYHSTDFLNTSIQDVLNRVSKGAWFNNWRILDIYPS
jgi:hypothetical protein